LVFSNKKGWFDIVLLALLLVFAFGLLSMFFGNFFSTINAEFQLDNDLSVESKELIGGLEGRYSSIFNGAFALLFVLFYLFCLFVSYNNTESVFFKVLAIVVMVLLVVMSILLASFYDELSLDDSLGGSFSEFPFINWVFNNFGLLALIFISSMIGMMALGGRSNAF